MPAVDSSLPWLILTSCLRGNDGNDVARSSMQDIAALASHFRPILI